MEEKTKLTDDQKIKDNEIIELKDDDMSTISAGSDTPKNDHTNINVYGLTDSDTIKISYDPSILEYKISKN